MNEVPKQESKRVNKQAKTPSTPRNRIKKCGFDPRKVSTCSNLSFRNRTLKLRGNGFACGRDSQPVATRLLTEQKSPRLAEDTVVERLSSHAQCRRAVSCEKDCPNRLHKQHRRLTRVVPQIAQRPANPTREGKARNAGRAKGRPMKHNRAARTNA